MPKLKPSYRKVIKLVYKGKKYFHSINVWIDPKNHKTIEATFNEVEIGECGDGEDIRISIPIEIADDFINCIKEAKEFYFKIVNGDITTL